MMAPVSAAASAAVGQEGIDAMSNSTLVGRIAEPEEMAATVCAIADPKLFGYTTGQIFHSNGGMYLA
jgi:NAD(P)-dependent dehydrogenase (short-subunit alcohol dehydrogenase family)